MVSLEILDCSDPEKLLFRENSTLDVFFRDFDQMTRAIALRAILALTFVYLLFNIFHLFILTRRSMRTLTVSKEMILIAVCGVINGTSGVIKNIEEIFEDEFLCAHSYYYHVVVIFNLCVYQLCNHIILWDIVYITFLRAAVILDVRYGIKTDKIRTSIQTFILLIFIVAETNHFCRISYQDIELDNGDVPVRLNGRECGSYKGYVVNTKSENCLRRVFLTIAGLTGLIFPIGILAVLSVFLIIHLRASDSSVAPNQTNRHNKTTHGLVLFLIFYVLAEIPLLILLSIGIYNPADFELPPVKKVDSFRVDIIPGLHGTKNHIQTYLVHYRDPALSPNRQNAMNLDYDKLQAYWKRAETFVSEKSELRLSENDRVKLENYQTALDSRDAFVADGHEFFSGCGGNEIKSWTAHLDAKFANAPTHVKYHASIKKSLLSDDKPAKKKKIAKVDKPKKEKPEKPKKLKKTYKSKRRSDSRSVTPEEWRR